MIFYEWQRKLNPFNGEDILRFNNYLAEAWANRQIYFDKEDSEISNEELLTSKNRPTQRFFDFTFDGFISARNYVGIVQFGGKRITVMPSVFRNRPEAVNWKFQMLYWLSYCRRIHFPFSFADISQMEFDDFLELLIYVFSHYTEELLSTQSYQSYELVVEDSHYLKGRLSFETYLQNNLITGRWHHFTCEHRPFVFDNRFNQIIKYVTRRLLAISLNERNKHKLETILFLLDEVTDCVCSAIDCKKVKLNSIFNDHQHILNLCHMFLSNQIIDANENDSSNFCFLVPMEYVFEDFIFSFLKRHFPKYDLRRQSPGYLAERNEKNVFGIKNDIFIPGKLVIDTKYVFRPNDDDLKAGVSQTHMYQMLAYALRRDCRKVVLVYPFYKSANNEKAEFSINSKFLSKQVLINAVSVDVVVDQIDNISSTMVDRLKVALFSD